MELADWDLHAVVRSCRTSIPTTTTTTSSSVATTSTNQNPPTTDLQNNPPPPTPPPFTYRSSPSFPRGELQDLFMSNLHFSLPPPSIPTAPFRPLGGGLISEQMAFQQYPEQQPPPKRARFVFGATTTTTTTTSSTSVSASAAAAAVSISSPDTAFSISNITPTQNQRHSGSVFCSTSTTGGGTSTSSQSQPKAAKKRKNLQKKVFHVSAEGLSSDMWAWRKYGQKPIKGSPYPRGYYRCSSSKGCLARKQVERNRSDPKMFIVTYTAEHNHPMPTHRNSLAGSTRQKPTTSADNAAASPSTNSTGLDSQPGCCSSPTARLSLSPCANMTAAETAATTSTSTTLAEPKTEPLFEDEDDDEVEDPWMKEEGNNINNNNNNGEEGGSEMMMVGFPDAVLGDDFFAGFGDLGAAADDHAFLHGRGGDDGYPGGGSSNTSSVDFDLPWRRVNGGGGGGCSGQPLVAERS